MSDEMLRLTPDELKTLRSELHGVLERWVDRPPQPRAENVHVILQAFPRRGAAP
jgi:hypothetical protein